MIHALRLVRGQDLKLSIQEYVLEKGIDAACILSAVGSVDHLKLRMAKAVEIREYDDDFEIVSVTGTVARGKSHIHMSFSDDRGNVVGGHLVNGTIINTTCEVVLMEIENYDFSREFDENTGYNELVIRMK